VASPRLFGRAFPAALGLIAPLVLLVLFVGATRLKATQARSEHPSIVLITLDTTRADHLGAWGYASARTPQLDQLARRGIRFAACETAAPVTLPAHATLLTGLLPPRHRVRDNGIFRLADEVETLAERFRAAGYDTAAVVSAIVLHRRHGLDQGFRVYDDDLGAGLAAGTEVAERTADQATAAARALLAKLRPPFFLWVHYYDPHEEYRPPSRLAHLNDSPSRLYDGEIAFMDEQVGELLSALPPSAIVAVAGDHGEMLGEHGENAHGILPMLAARRVPCLLAGPGIPAGRVVEALVRTADIAPTLAQVAGLPARGEPDGRSLLPLPQASGPLAYCESFLPFYAYKWYPLRTVSDGRWVFLQAPTPALFDLQAEAGELADVARRWPEKTEFFRRELAALLRRAGEELAIAAAPDSALTAEQAAQLASLGYLGSASGWGKTLGLPDPRQRMEIARRLDGAAEAVQQGGCPTALRELRAIVQEDPRNFPALTLAAQCLRDAGRQRDALALYERAQRENPASAVPIANLGLARFALGEKSAAEREFRRALVLDPTQGESLTHLARLLRERGRAREAIEVLDRAIAAGALAPAVFLERGTARTEAGDLAAGIEDFREAARRDPQDSTALENAARAAYALGRKREAALTYESVLRLAPRRGDLWKTLGAVYLNDLDDGPGAARAFQAALRLETDAAERARLEATLKELLGGQ
jgi:arylsulfatase A-like enzyme/Tfp pilus assembly protein PilF